ncbi:MAG: archaemetzincin [Deltaproteobacteria bacterium]
MIHVVTLEPFPAEEVQAVCRALFNAYGVGSELAGGLELPEDARVGDALDAVKLLAEVEQVKTFADDKVLYLVQQPLAPRESPVGPLPTHGFSRYGADRAVASAGILPLPKGAADPEQARTIALAKLAIHQVGHLWDLHHCLDARCAMAPPWGVAWIKGGQPELCAFCRAKSERRMKTAPA